MKHAQFNASGKDFHKTKVHGEKSVKLKENENEKRTHNSAVTNIENTYLRPIFSRAVKFSLIDTYVSLNFLIRFLCILRKLEKWALA